jgi:prepilin-type N-terminal cleavage/methylation domain-containing protein
MQRQHRSRGFTLIELMIVVSVIGILASFAAPRFTRAAARAQRSEMLGVLEKMRTHFIHKYRSNGSFGDPSAPVQENPDPVTHPLGQIAEWDSTRAGWVDYPFPPNGALRMRYVYLISGGSGDHLTLQARGRFPGLDTDYLYTETWVGDRLLDDLQPVEFPQF